MQDSDNQIHYWNRIGPSKPFGHPVNVERLAVLLRRDSRILDFGCGYGRALGLLHQHGYTRLIGVDPASSMISAARERFPHILFEELADAPRLAMSDASVDAVFLFAVLTCVPTDEGQRSIIQEISRVLHPGGLLYISDLWLQIDQRNIDRYEHGQAKYGKYGVFDLPEGVTLRHHDRGWIETLTSDYDLAAIDEIELQTMNGNTAQGFQWFGRKKR